MVNIPETWDLPAVLRSRVGRFAGRQRCMFADGHLLLLLHAPAKPEDAARNLRMVWRDPQGQWRAHGVGSLDQHLEDFRTALFQCDRLADTADTADEYFNILRTLDPLQRTVANLYTVLQDARKSVPDDADIIDYRDTAYQLTRRCDLLSRLAKNALDFTVAKEAEETSEASHHMSVAAHRLNMLAAVFFPILTLAALFSTNFQTGLESLTPPWPFVIMLAIGMGCGVLLNWFISRSKS